MVTYTLCIVDLRRNSWELVTHLCVRIIRLNATQRPALTQQIEVSVNVSCTNVGMVLYIFVPALQSL